MSICAGCGKKVIFAPDAFTGKMQILDAVAPVYALADDGELVTVTRARQHYVSHFATCPKANEFSKSTKGKT